MTIGDYIKEYRRINNISMEEFAKRSGMSKAYVSILERNYNPSTGKPAVPSLETIRNVAQATGYDFNELLNTLDKDQHVLLTKDATGSIPKDYIPLPQSKLIPIVGEIACGEPITAEQNIESYVQAPIDSKADFALICRGDSMIDAGIKDGDIVYIRKQPQVENGQIAAVRIDNTATLKRVFFDGNTLYLQAANSLYPPLSYSGPALSEVAIEGLALGYTHWF